MKPISQCGQTIIFRADANQTIGAGHIMRSVALAEALREYGCKAIFVISPNSPAIEERILSEGMVFIHVLDKPGSREDAFFTSRVAKKSHAKWIVTDGYQFGSEFQKIIKKSGHTLLFIDDYGHADHYFADIILNQNISADRELYQKSEPYTQFCLGLKFVLLRREFLIWRRWNRQISGCAQKILVTFGGSDAENITAKVIEALKQIKTVPLDVLVVVGGVNPRYEEYLASVKKFPGINIKKNVDNMPELMAWADVAISAGGTTCWELAYMGTPSIVYAVSENQKPIVSYLYSEGCAEVFKETDLQNPEVAAYSIMTLLTSSNMRTKLSQRMKRLVDGEGSERVIMKIFGADIRIRKVSEDDCKLLWDWANDTDVRNMAFNEDLIPYADHCQWFQDKQKNPNCYFFVGINSSDIPVGQIRFDCTGDQAELDVSIDRKWRNKGYGAELIKTGCERIFCTTQIKIIHAFVKIENLSSLKSFEHAGFLPQENMKIKGNDVIHMIKTGSNTGRRNG